MSDKIDIAPEIDALEHKRHSESPRERVKYLTALLADHAEDTMDADDVDQVRAEIIAQYDGLVEQKETADRALRAIHFNASSWHAGEEGCRRALNVIQAWAAHPESVPEGVGETSSPAKEPS